MQGKTITNVEEHTMTQFVMDEYDIREIKPFRKRFEKIKELYQSDDESVRWECVWLTGEIAEALPKHDRMYSEIENWFVSVLRSDSNGVVKHEAAFQIGLHNIRNKIPDLIGAVEDDKNSITRHEAIEALGLLRFHGANHYLEKWSKDSDEAVSETAKFVLKRLERLKDKGAYRDGEPI